MTRGTAATRARAEEEAKGDIDQNTIDEAVRVAELVASSPAMLYTRREGD